MKDKTRKHLRATLATTCALSLAASLAFPLVALAHTGNSEEAALQPAAAAAEPAAKDASADAPATKEVATAELPVAKEAAAAETAATKPTAAAEATVTKSTAAAEATVAPASATEATAQTTPANESLVASEAMPASSQGTASQALDAANSAAPTEAADSTNAPAEPAGKTGNDVTYINVSLRPSPPREFASAESMISPFCRIPLGMSFQEAEQKGLLKEGSTAKSKDYFFNLGTENPIGVGDAHPDVPGYTFAGWMFPYERSVVSATTPIAERADELYILVGSWKKDGSNVISSTDSRLGGLDVVAEGNLAGANAPAGADMRVVSNVAVSAFYYDDFISDAEKDMVDTNKFHVRSVDLFVDGKQVHDGFGSMKLTFYDYDGFSEGATVRVWHKHLDGTVTHEDVKPVGDTVSITVTDLSMFAYAELGKDPNQTQPGDDQKPGTDGGNQGTQQPGGNNGDGGDKKDEGNNKNDGNGDKKDEGNKNDNGGDKKTDDGKQGGSGDKGNNKNGGNLAKTGDEMRYALGGTMAALTIALFTGGTALLMGNRKRPAHRHRS